MKITVNGESKDLTSKDKKNSLKSLITQFGYHPQLIVIELNGLIIKPEEWNQTTIKDGDCLEIVTIVGGG